MIVYPYTLSISSRYVAFSPFLYKSPKIKVKGHKILISQYLTWFYPKPLISNGIWEHDVMCSSIYLQTQVFNIGNH